jgi:hypothetical protein
MLEKLPDPELLQRLTLLAATAASLPDEIKQALWENAKQTSPDDPLATYLNRVFKNDQFLFDLLSELRKEPH